MGQNISTNGDNGENVSSSDLSSIRLFTKSQTAELFKILAFLKLSSLEVKTISTKLNITDLNESNALSYSDLSYVLGLSQNKDQDNDAIHPKFNYVIKLLYESFKFVGKFPFLQDYTFKNSDALNVDDLIISSFFHSGRYKKILSSDYNYSKLIFLSLSYPKIYNNDTTNSLGQNPKHYEKCSEKPNLSESFAEGDHETFQIEIQKSHFADQEETNEILAKRVKWGTFNHVQSFDEIEIDSLTIKAYDLVQLFTLFLILTSIPKKEHSAMQEQTINSITNKWSDFEFYALSLVRYINLEINDHNLKTYDISYKNFKTGMDKTLVNLITDGLTQLFKNGLLSAVHSDKIKSESKVAASHVPKLAQDNGNKTKSQRVKHTFPKFEESKLVNNASLALMSIIFNASDIKVTNQNLVNLYSGSESGFSIRSLELKIFKWQAPTLLMVSGKRLKSKTTKSNKRYHQFISEYPRYFRTPEESKKEWQSDNDTITYAVLIKAPWRTSNKKNFGDENTKIISLSPRLDFYNSVMSPIHKSELIYFNNLGLGLGFGNEQPINKHNVKRYVPGDVSLTIDANLEFGVFRHISSVGTNASSFFTKSQQLEAKNEDFEDRFMITDLEVWGIGSTAELEEQRLQWEWEEKQAAARQSVNLKNMGEERAFLEMVGLAGNHNASGGSI